MKYRIGQGFDTHKLEIGTPLVIGGVSIPNNKGSVGHSDGDVLYHAIVDACLGAMAKGDIGKEWCNVMSRCSDKNDFNETPDICWVIALKSEAIPIISQFKLSLLSNELLFPIYKNQKRQLWNRNIFKWKYPWSKNATNFT